MKRIILALGLILASTPGITKEACEIIYSNDLGRKITKEIRDHEFAHCNKWSHPKGWRTKTKAWAPPKDFLKDFKGSLYEVPAPSEEVREMCEGQLGCSTLYNE